MPLYEYKCVNKACKKFGVLELIPNDIDARNKQKCPVCKKRMNRLVSKTSFVIK